MTSKALSILSCLDPWRGVRVRLFQVVVVVVVHAFGPIPAVTQDLSPEANDNAISFVAPTFWAISVADVEVSTAWYGRVFQAITLRDVQSRDGMGKARILRSGPLVLELIERAGSVARSRLLPAGSHDFDMQGHVKSGVFVRNAGQLHERWSREGVAMDQEVLVDEFLQVLTFVIRDPDGNRIQIFEEMAARPEFDRRIR